MQQQSPKEKYSGVSYTKCSILLLLLILPLLLLPKVTSLIDGDTFFPGKTLGNKYVSVTRNSFEEDYRKGISYIETNDLEKAFEYFERFIQRIPADQQRSLYAHTKEKSYVQLIDLGKKLDKPNLTDQYYSDLIEFKPTHVNYMTEYATFLHELGEYEEALKYIDMAHELAITELGIVELKLTILYELGEHEEFRKLYEAFESAEYFSFTRGRVFLTDSDGVFSGENTFWVEDIIADGHFHSYTVDLTTQENFSKLPETINQFRFDPGHNTREFLLDSIEFTDAAGNVLHRFVDFSDWKKAGIKLDSGNVFINLWPKTSMQSTNLNIIKPSQININVQHTQGLSDKIHTLYQNLP